MKILWPQIREFCVCIFYCLDDKELRQKTPECASFRSLPFCRKALTALQRGCRCIAAVAPLERESGPVAGSGGPRWSAAVGFLTDDSGEM